MLQLTRSDLAKLLRERKWTVVALAERWGLSRRYVTSKIANERRGQFWNDAFAGLPEGPGFYRKRPKGEGAAPAQSVLQIGSLVASEAEMDEFGFGSRGVVIEILSPTEWKVIWDGGKLMTIDQDCLNEWVVDLGLRIADYEKLANTAIEKREDVAKMINLYS